MGLGLDSFLKNFQDWMVFRLQKIFYRTRQSSKFAWNIVEHQLFAVDKSVDNL